MTEWSLLTGIKCCDHISITTSWLLTLYTVQSIDVYFFMDETFENTRAFNPSKLKCTLYPFCTFDNVVLWISKPIEQDCAHFELTIISFCSCCLSFPCSNVQIQTYQRASMMSLLQQKRTADEVIFAYILLYSMAIAQS